MERALAHSHESSRHPLRRALPLAPAMPGDGFLEGQDSRWENTRLFLTTFVAGFIAFYGMIA